MTADLTASRALVTGAGHGIGRAIAVALADAGADVAIHYGQSEDGAEDTAARIISAGRRAKTFQADVRDSAEVSTLVSDATDFLGGLDILVTNAGHLVGRALVAEMTDDHWQQVLDVNLTSTFLTCRAALPSLIASRGRIVTMASLAAHNGGGAGATGVRGREGGCCRVYQGAGQRSRSTGRHGQRGSPGLHCRHCLPRHVHACGRAKGDGRGHSGRPWRDARGCRCRGGLSELAGGWIRVRRDPRPDRSAVGQVSAVGRHLTIPDRAGGWWHEYVCPVHGVELLPAHNDSFPCSYGCVLTGEPYTGAWAVLAHQAAARSLRRLAGAGPCRRPGGRRPRHRRPEPLRGPLRTARRDHPSRRSGVGCCPADFSSRH
ncbi:SDR family NAD(P)-dependent oxidoreductase [Fodinicola feengrottensis]|nr:SDR family NAD(P)-dependent oxidoreductase [Fodinicola feengrottensis]